MAEEGRGEEGKEGEREVDDELKEEVRAREEDG